jgi:hypothetical protein
MATTYIIGNDGDVSLGSGITNKIKVRTFAATLARSESDLTGFGDSGRRRRLGMLDLTGSFTGSLEVNDAGTTNTAVMFNQTSTTAIVLGLFDGTATNDCRIAANCIVNNYAFASDKTQDVTITANFANADGAAPVVTWLV